MKTKREKVHVDEQDLVRIVAALPVVMNCSAVFGRANASGTTPCADAASAPL
jgi:hypothetical protein